MGHPIDAIGLDFSQPVIQEIHRAVTQAVRKSDAALDIAERAGIDTTMLPEGQPVYFLWKDIFQNASTSIGARVLLSEVAKNHIALARRIEELLGPAPPLDPPGKIAWKKPEALTGARSTLRDIGFLAGGLRAARSVVYVLADFGGGQRQNGTAFVIGRGLVLTNHHVVVDKSGAKAATITLMFDFEVDADGNLPASHSSAGRVIATDATFDWAVISVESKKEELLADRVPLPLDGGLGIAAGADVFIIQHALGMPKRIGIGHNEVRHVDDDQVQYLADTDLGSSGAPVFDERWRVVALHRCATIFEARGEPPEYRNEGVRIARVRDGIRQAGIRLEGE